MVQLSAKKAFFGLGFSHEEKWKHVSECSASQAVWNVAKEAYFSLTHPEYWVMSYMTGRQLVAGKIAARAWKLPKESQFY